MAPPSSFPERAARLAKVIEFILKYFWYIYVGLACLSMGFCVASYLSVDMSRRHSVGVGVVFVAVTWIFVFVVALWRQSVQKVLALNDPPET